MDLFRMDASAPWELRLACFVRPMKRNVPWPWDKASYHVQTMNWHLPFR